MILNSNTVPLRVDVDLAFFRLEHHIINCRRCLDLSWLVEVPEFQTKRNMKACPVEQQMGARLFELLGALRAIEAWS